MPETITDELVEKIARLMHEEYLREALRRAVVLGKLVIWQDLTEFRRVFYRHVARAVIEELTGRKDT